MSANAMCTVDPDLITKFKKFKTTRLGDAKVAVFQMKVDKTKMQVVEDYEDLNTTFAEIVEELPPVQPRYVALVYKYAHPDGRASFPLVFLYYIPESSNPALNMLYSSSKTTLSNELAVGKEFELRNPDDLNEKWLNTKLKLFD